MPDQIGTAPSDKTQADVNAATSAGSSQNSFQLERRLRVLREEQSFGKGFLGGFAASFGIAVAWAIVTVVTDHIWGIMAILVGVAVGYAVRVTGRGVESKFGWLGAALSLVGCLMGNLMAVSIVVGQDQGIPFWALFISLNPLDALQILAFTFHPLDLLFYAIAMYEGYRLSFSRPVAPVQPVELAS